MTEHLRIAPTPPRIQYLADGAQTAFPFPFALFAATDLRLFVGAAPQAGGYAVTGIGDSDGGTVTFTAPPPAGAVVTLQRRLPIQRLTDFQEGGAFRAKVINDELDYQTAVAQQLADDLAQAVRRAPTSSNTADLTLPEPAAGKAIGWNADGSGLVNDPADFAGLVGTVTAQAEQAAASSQQAAGSAAAAAIDRAAIAADRVAVAGDRAAVEAYAQGTGFLSTAANLSDLADPAAARTNLGLAAVAASGAYADLTGRPALGSAAAASLGTGAGQVPTADQIAGLVQGVPTGAVTMHAGATAPDGWLLCQGQAVSRTAYAALFAAIGVAHGGGDGATTFNLPDLRGRAPIGIGTGSGLTARTMGQKLGAETHTLSTTEMPSHNHSKGNTYGNSASYPDGNYGYGLAGTTYTGNSGGGGAHNNMPPSYGLNFIIKT